MRPFLLNILKSLVLFLIRFPAFSPFTNTIYTPGRILEGNWMLSLLAPSIISTFSEISFLPVRLTSSTIPFPAFPFKIDGKSVCCRIWTYGVQSCICGCHFSCRRSSTTYAYSIPCIGNLRLLHYCLLHTDLLLPEENRFLHLHR